MADEQNQSDRQKAEELQRLQHVAARRKATPSLFMPKNKNKTAAGRGAGPGIGINPAPPTWTTSTPRNGDLDRNVAEDAAVSTSVPANPATPNPISPFHSGSKLALPPISAAKFGSDSGTAAAPAIFGETASPSLAEAEARAKKAQDEKDAEGAEYHQIIANHQIKLDEQSKELSDLKSTINKLRKENSTLEYNLDVSTGDVRKKGDEINKLQGDIQTEKGLQAYSHEEFRLQGEALERSKGELKKVLQSKKSLEGQVADLTSMNYGLHERVDEFDDQTIQLENTRYEADRGWQLIQSLHSQFEEIVDDFAPGDDFDKILQMFKSQQLRRETSHSSLGSDASGLRNPKTRKVSLADQLKDGELSGDELDDEDVDDDPTLSNIQTSENALSLSAIQPVETAPVAPTAPASDFSQITSVNTAPPQPSAPELGMSKIVSVSTSPQRCTIPRRRLPPRPQRLGFSRIVSTEIEPTPQTQHTIILYQPASSPSTPGDIWHLLPWWAKLLLLILALLYLYLLGGVAYERYLWLSANDDTYQMMMDLTLGSESSWLTPMLFRLEDWIGIDNSLLG